MKANSQHPPIGQGHELRSPEDILREVAGRRIEKTFGDHLPEERMRLLEDHPDAIEDEAEFVESAEAAGLEPRETVLGFSESSELPAHVRRSDATTELATLIHEDLHRLTDPETKSDFGRDEEHRKLYEGLTEVYTQRAFEPLGESGAVAYPQEMQMADDWIKQNGDDAVQDYYFEHTTIPEERY